MAYFGLACAQLGPKPADKWLAGDFHNHTTLTDGSHSMDEDFAHANQFSLDWWANSEHGGAFSRNTCNQYFDTLTSPATCPEKFKVHGSKPKARAGMNFSRFVGGPQAHEELQ